MASALAVATLLLSGPPLRAQAATPICEVLSATTAVTVIGEVKQKRAIPKAGGRVALMVASGSTMWTFAVDHVYRSGDAGGTLPQLKDAAKEALEKK